MEPHDFHEPHRRGPLFLPGQWRCRSVPSEGCEPRETSRQRSPCPEKNGRTRRPKNYGEMNQQLKHLQQRHRPGSADTIQPSGTGISTTSTGEGYGPPDAPDGGACADHTDPETGKDKGLPQQPLVSLVKRWFSGWRCTSSLRSRSAFRCIQAWSTWRSPFLLGSGEA
jgi:hypothetical protein